MRRALLDRLRILDRDGFLQSSRLSQSMRKEIRSLFHAGILEDRRSGAGRRVVVANESGFRRWVNERLPLGLEPDLSGPPRSAAVAAFRNAKVARRTDAEPVVMRVFTEQAVIEIDSVAVAGQTITEQVGCVSLLLSDERQVTLCGRIGMVENLESFLYAERLGPQLDAVMYSGGRLSHRMLAWMGMQPTTQWVHLGDYDPVGLSEYLRVAKACPGRVTLWVPPGLENLVARYGKGLLMEASSNVWAKVRQSEDADVRRVVAVLDRHAKGLEHEILLRDR